MAVARIATVARICAGLGLALAAMAAPAAAQHAHHGGGDPASRSDDRAAPCGGPTPAAGGSAPAPCRAARAPRSSFGAAVGLIAARYDAMLFSGDYEGLAVALRWSRGRLAAAAGVTGYRIDKNGKVVSGVGDAMIHGHAALWARGGLAAGASAMVMLPTGAHHAGLGMGHVMLMPSAWAAWSPAAARGRLALGASTGYARGLGDASLHAAHGGSAWPLVDPMTPSELTYGASALAQLAPPLRAGLRVDGAVPLAEGEHRLVGGVRAVWARGRIETTAEVAAGLAGDPFGVRGLLEAAVRFR
jgi:hypothetical protein